MSFLPHKRHCVSEFANKFAACRMGVRESVGDARARFTVVAADRPANGQSPSMLFIEGLWFGERTSARFSGVISQQPRTDLRSCMPCFFARYSPPPQHLSRSLRHPRHSLLAVLSPLFCPSLARLRHRSTTETGAYELRLDKRVQVNGSPRTKNPPYRQSTARKHPTTCAFFLRPHAGSENGGKRWSPCSHC